MSFWLELEAMEAAAAVQFTVLTVCTGNICRSPAAQYLLADALGPTVGVRSAGTGALEGAPVDPQMAAILPLDTSSFIARQLSRDLIDESDLILGLTREHRGRAVEIQPAAVRRTFTLRELARILSLPEFRRSGGTPGETLADFLPRAATVRARARAANPSDDDIADPYRQSDEVFSVILGEIAAAVDTITRAVLR